MQNKIRWKYLEMIQGKNIVCRNICLSDFTKTMTIENIAHLNTYLYKLYLTKERE